jgi:hypothetical protein
MIKIPFLIRRFWRKNPLVPILRQLDRHDQKSTAIKPGKGLTRNVAIKKAISERSGAGRPRITLTRSTFTPRSPVPTTLVSQEG